MAFNYLVGESRYSSDRSSSSVSFTNHSNSLFNDAPLSRSFQSRSSIGTAELVSSRATKRNAILIRRSGFQDSRRVGRRENDPRYYRFSLKRSGRIDITVQNLEFAGLIGFSVPNVKVRLERSNGKALIKRTIAGGNLEFISRKLDRNNTYYIRVTSAGQSVPYRVSLRTRGAAELSR